MFGREKSVAIRNCHVVQRELPSFMDGFYSFVPGVQPWLVVNDRYSEGSAGYNKAKEKLLDIHEIVEAEKLNSKMYGETSIFEGKAVQIPLPRNLQGMALEDYVFHVAIVLDPYSIAESYRERLVG